MKLLKFAMVLGLPLLVAGCGPSSGRRDSEGARPEFVVGGQIPFWIIAGEAGTPSGTPEAEIGRHAIQARAAEMFDVVIPSSIHWNWVEEQRGELDFHRFDWANDWAVRNDKAVFVQHILWAWSDTKPDWVWELSDEEFRVAVLRHVHDVRSQVGDVSWITVINEMTCKTYLQDRLGPGIVKDLFDETRIVFPDTELLLNEHGCPGEEDVRNRELIGNTLDNYADLVLELIGQRVDFDRIGFQSYFSDGDVIAQGGIEAFVAKYSKAVDHFAERTGYKLTITELGFSAADEDFRASFLRAFFDMAVENPNIDGLFLFHWLDDQAPGTALINRDGSLTRAGEVFYEVFGR